MAGLDGKEIEGFLSKIDKVSSVIKGLTSGDGDLQAQAEKEADEIIGKKHDKVIVPDGFDKTHINKYDDDKNGHTKEQQNNPLQFSEESVSPEDFMKRVELDAAERRERRQQDDKIANELKEKGNNSFRRKEYEAVKYYDEAIKKVRDNAVLYTNRAQALIHIGKNERALEDCLMAQKIDSKYVKAIIHQGRALQNLRKFDEAIENFQRVKTIDKKHTKLIEGYVQEAKRRQEIHEKEKQSILLESSGDVTTKKIKEIISKLRKEELSYTRLNEVLKELKDYVERDVDKTLFRTSGGFKMLAENPAISRLLKKEKAHSDDELESITQVLNLLSKVCLECEENTRELLHPSLFSYLTKFISSSFSLDIRIATACLAQIISQLEDGRKFLLQNGENECVLNELLSLLTSNDRAAIIAAGVITNLALFDGLSEESSTKICIQFVTFIKPMMEIFSSLEKESIPAESVISLVSQSITTITNLARSLRIRTELSTDRQLWKTSARMLETYEKNLENELIRKLVFCLLGLLMNLSVVEKCTDLETCQDVTVVCCRLLTCSVAGIVERSAGLLSHLFTSYSELVHYSVEKKIYLKFLCVLKGQNDAAKNFIIKCIALCSSCETTIASDLVQNKALKSLLHLLKSGVDNVAGNSALTIGNCASNKTFSEELASTNVIQDLLRIATDDGYKHVVKHNAAIAIGKLSTSDPRHLERLRELHGLEILHQVLKETQT